MPFRIVTPPPAEPVTLAEAKTWCRESGTDQDSLITRLITSHRIFAEETLTGRAFVKRTLQAFFPSFGCDGILQLPFAPLIAVSAVEYTDYAGNAATVAASVYQVDIYSEPGRIKPNWSQYWPAIRSTDFNPVRVTYDCGYAPTGSPLDYAAPVPENLKEWLLRRVATAYENREALQMDARGMFVVERSFVDGLIDSLVLGCRSL